MESVEGNHCLLTLSCQGSVEHAIVVLAIGLGILDGGSSIIHQHRDRFELLALLESALGLLRVAESEVVACSQREVADAV